MIALLAVRDLDGPLLRGDVFACWYAVHQNLLDDSPLMTAVARDVTEQVAEGFGADVTPAHPVCVYLFAPGDLDAVFARHVNAFYREEPLPPNMGAIVAVWRAPR